MVDLRQFLFIEIGWIAVLQKGLGGIQDLAVDPYAVCRTDTEIARLQVLFRADLAVSGFAGFVFGFEKVVDVHVVTTR